MTNIYHENRVIRACSCDLHGICKPTAILEILQETAGAHSNLLGMTTEKMAQLGCGWALTRLKLEMARLPQMDEEIAIETYPTAARHMFFPRSHILRDMQGEVIGRANALWVVLDLNERKMVRNEEVFAAIPLNEGLSMAAGMPASVRALQGDVREGEVRVQYTDLDTNRHVNNTKYMDWCLNALGMELLEEKCISGVDISYEAEILPGSVVRTELTMDGDRFAFMGYVGDKRHFAIGGTLAAR